MNKLTLLALSTVFIGSQVHAQEAVEPMLSKGTKELALSGTIEFPGYEKIDFDIDASYGYFIKDGWELGTRVLGADVSGVERFDFSLFTEYNFNRSSNIVPYIGASVGLASVDFSDLKVSSTLPPSDGESTVFGVQGGIKWFVRPYMAITTAINFSVAADDIYAADNALDDNLTRLRIGMRYYF